MVGMNSEVMGHSYTQRKSNDLAKMMNDYRKSSKEENLQHTMSRNRKYKVILVFSPNG